MKAKDGPGEDGDLSVGDWQEMTSANGKKRRHQGRLETGAGDTKLK